MAMNPKTRSLLSLLVLAALALGAGLYAYYGVQVKQEKEKAAKERKEKLFPDLDKAKLTQLTVTAKGETTVLSRSKSTDPWSLVSPVTALADKAAVDSLIDRLASMRSKSVVEEKAADLKRYGLDPPSIKIVAKAEDGTELVLRCGEENSFDSSVYVAMGGSNEVLSAEGGFKYALEKTTFDLRDKRLVPVEESEIAGIEVTAPGGRYQLAKEEGRWRIVQPFADRADDQAVGKIVNAIRNLRATRFVTDTASAPDLAKVGLDKPKAEATLSLTSGVKMALEWSQISEPDKKTTYARRRDATFIAEVPETILAELDVKPADLRDKSLLTFDKDQVAKATFTLSDGTLTVERKKPEGDAGRSEEWVVTAPSPGEAKKWKMSSVLWGLSSLKAASIVEDKATDFAKYGLDKPSRSVTLFGSDGKELGTLSFGKEEADKVFARNAAEPRVFAVDKARLGELPASRADLEEAKAADGGTAKK